MCEYCEGVEGKPLSSDANFKVTVEPYYSRLRIEHGCGFCDSWSFRHVDIDVLPQVRARPERGRAMTPPKHPTVCNICGGKVSYVSNARVYGSRYGSGWCYLCESCGAYVGTHGPRPREALGISPTSGCAG